MSFLSLGGPQVVENAPAKEPCSGGQGAIKTFSPNFCKHIFRIGKSRDFFFAFMKFW